MSAAFVCYMNRCHKPRPSHDLRYLLGDVNNLLLAIGFYIQGGHLTPVFGPYVSVWCQRLTIWFVPDDLCFTEYPVTVTSRLGVVKVEFGTLFFNP